MKKNAIIPALITVLCAVYLLQATRLLQVDNLVLQPYSTGRFKYWQLVTYCFIHGSFGHLVINCVSLYSFGKFVINNAGVKYFFILLSLAVVSGGLLQAAVSEIPTAGISAGICALIVFSASIDPQIRITPILPMFSISLGVFTIILTAFTGLALIIHYLPGIAHAAHAGGFLTAIYPAVYYYVTNKTQ